MPHLLVDHGDGRLAGCVAIAAIDQAAHDGAVETFDEKEVAGDRDADIATGIVIANHGGEIAECG